jgi:hypothetical protein
LENANDHNHQNGIEVGTMSGPRPVIQDDEYREFRGYQDMLPDQKYEKKTVSPLK